MLESHVKWALFITVSDFATTAPVKSTLFFAFTVELGA